MIGVGVLALATNPSAQQVLSGTARRRSRGGTTVRLPRTPQRNASDPETRIPSHRPRQLDAATVPASRYMLAAPMRGLLVLVAVAALAAAWLLTRDDAPAAPPDATIRDASGAAAPIEPSAGTAVATRIAAPATPPPELADAPTACLRVVDHGNGQPIAGAPVRSVQAGNDIAFTDERGLAPLPLRAQEQLAVVVDGYLLRMVPTQLGTTEAEPQEVRLVRDEYSIVRRCEFPGANGPVFVRFRPVTPQGRPQPPVPDDPVLQRAWMEHVTLASRPVCADVRVQLGAFDENRVHRLVDGAEVRFAFAGEFAVEAATADGLVGAATLRHDGPPRNDAPPVRVVMARGAFATGTVVGPDGTPLAGARLVRQGGEPLGLVATTAADGTFRFGPLPAEPVVLHVRHDDHTPLAFGPFAVPANDVRIVLQPLAGATLRGRVRGRPDGRPIAGATVQWTPAGLAPVSATTGGDGTFSLRATGTTDARLGVSAPGWLFYAEIVAPGAPFADYDLWPATTDSRLAHGLTALLEGVVLDARGAPISEAEVRWIPQQRPAPRGVPTRRALEGAVLELPFAARTGSDGAFRLETHAFGAGRLALADGSIGVDTTASAGQTTSGLRLRP